MENIRDHHLGAFAFVLEFVCLPWSEVCSARVTSLLLLLLLLLLLPRGQFLMAFLNLNGILEPGFEVFIPLFALPYSTQIPHCVAKLGSLWAVGLMSGSCFLCPMAVTWIEARTAPSIQPVLCSRRVIRCAAGYHGLLLFGACHWQAKEPPKGLILWCFLWVWVTSPPCPWLACPLLQTLQAEGLILH